MKGLRAGVDRPARETQFGVEIRPLLVATIQRLPQRTIESIRPTPGTVSPRAARHTPSGPSSTTVPPTTSRTVQPSIVVGRVSGTAAGLGDIRVRSRETVPVDVGEAAACCAVEVSLVGGGAAC